MKAASWLLWGGALATGAYIATHKKSRVVESNEPLTGRWVWPLGTWQGRKPEISDGFNGTRRSSSGNPIGHGGVDVMYRRQAADTWSVGSPNGSRLFVMPDHRAVLAASDGRVWSASLTPRGWSVVIDHAPRKVATYYTHMTELLVTPKQEVHAGQPIGIVGADPLDAQHLKHLHFETWRGGPNDRFDPEPLMHDWERIPDPGDLPQTVAARNARQRVEHAPGERFVVQQHTRRYPRR